MPAPNIIPFPHARHRRTPAGFAPPSGVPRGHQRATVRVLAPPARQMPLPLPPDATLEARIRAARATVANYDALAASSRPSAASLYRRFALAWQARLAALLEEQAALAVQSDLPIPTAP